MVAPLTPAEIISALNAWGIPHVAEKGWENRHNGSGWGDVTGFMWHHTGDDAPDTADLRTVRDGHSSLPGPLCNFGLDDNGVVHLVAAGAANHAGGGDPRVLEAVMKESYTGAPPAPRYIHGEKGSVSGNGRFYGVETFYYRHLTPAARAMMPRLAAAIIWALDKKDTKNSWSEKSAIGHKEWQRGKIDPRLDGGDTCATLRAETAAYLKAGPGNLPRPVTVQAPRPTSATTPAPVTYNRAKTASFQRMLELSPDGLWGANTDEWALRMRTAARAHCGWPKKVSKPFREDYVQRVIDVVPDNVWGPKSQAALERWIYDLQKLLGVARDGVWGPGTDRAFLEFRADNRNKF